MFYYDTVPAHFSHTINGNIVPLLMGATIPCYYFYLSR